jgi:5-formyltetrahydrofolate cyclo-ligase
MTLDPAVPRELVERAKVQLRKRMRALRGAYPEAALAERSARIVARLSALPELETARGVALFWPITARNEVDLRALDTTLRTAQKRIYYPGVGTSPAGKPCTELRLTESSSDLAPREQRFFEPPHAATAAARGDVDLVVVPALAVAASGHRLGYGAGYYDSLLPDFRPPAKAVVVAFDFQLLAELPALEHDVPSDFVVTDVRTIVTAG